MTTEKKGKIKMDKDKLYEIVEKMTEQLGTQELLDSLVMAMSSKELQENLEYIDRMNDLDNF